jgi:glycosyltransferase involved in cell wall biosynthesis
MAADAPPYKGGVARLVGILSDKLRSRGHKVTILAPKFRIGEFKPSLIPFRSYDDYDVIHLHGPTPLLSDIAFVTNRGLPIVYTHHCEVSWLSEKLSRIYRAFHRSLARRAKAIIVSSSEYMQLFDGFQCFLIRIPCPFESPANFSIEEKADKPFTVLFVGQFRLYKGLGLLLRVANILKDVRFILVGEGYLKLKIVSEVRIRGLRNVEIRSAHTDDDLKKLYMEAHVICLPSINTSEAWGIVLNEGALYGCVPIASNLPGVRENVLLLRGLTFERGSYLSLAAKIKYLSEDKLLWLDHARRSQDAAIRYAKVYTPDYYVCEHEKLYETLHKV